MNGNRVRTIYVNHSFSVSEIQPRSGEPAPEPPTVNVFDGRDDHGNMLKAGIYIMQVILEPVQDQIRRGLVVVR